MRAFARLFIAIFTFVNIVLPIEGYAEPGQFVPSSWHTVRVGQFGEVAFPLDNWREMARIQPSTTGATADLMMIQGERWITLGREEAGMLGLSSDKLSELARRFSTAPPMVIARYSPENAQLRINVIKMERGQDRIVRTWIADFTPHHGERWRWGRRHYLTAQEEQNQDRPGRNPFLSFLSSAQPEDYSTRYCQDPYFRWNGLCTDPVFYNISWAGVQVAVGHAMRHYNSHIAFIAVTENRFDQRVITGGGLLRRRVTQIIEGYSKPRWFVATPRELQPHGMHAQICALPGASSCPDIRLVATSGVLVDEWRGGTMPETEELVYRWQQTRSSWTVLAFALFTAALFSLGWGMGLDSLFTAGFGSSGYSAIPAYTAGSIAGATYAGVSLLTRGGALTSAQEGYLGATDSGFFLPPAPGDQHSAALAEATRNRMINPQLGDSLTGVRQLYRGDCPENYTAAQCRAAGLDPGGTYRPDMHREFNTVLWMRRNYERCRQLGYTGETLRKCAAPLPSGVFTSQGYE